MNLRCAILCAFLFGGIAQLVERLNGIQKVRGSTPLTSTIKRKIERKTANGRLFLFLCQRSRAVVGKSNTPNNKKGSSASA